MHEAPPDGNQEPDGESRGDDGPLQSGFVGLAQPLGDPDVRRDDCAQGERNGPPGKSAQREDP
ncbi:hypothetical protein Jden_0772 [Jonesia denitrificans DSM 20603]|uniref:Uncharacterized protein n=1 Tax=Jonesia denitrificans (strain ATCC 14870 / DSM 20603 / BCRC 15368 / CIP 55.134 / JCM 11481 / NBRC 15587 / NCTC 10816 / Prevot 55134) TaxID=471856 RepID=C7R1W7_JONDD|nr:hypothetical protein Jden_0772 [Jonesia denitrificans DSM 20603]